jgi:lysyl-tRNA synthetase class 2
VARAAGYDGEVDFTPPYRRVTLRDAIHEATGIDVLAARDRDALAAAIAASVHEIPTDGLTWPQLVDDLFSKVVEPTLVQPTFVIDYPIELSPLAKKKRDNARLVDRFELFIGRRELANAYSELNDPIDQLARFREQAAQKARGDDEAHWLDEDYVRALEYGMPPAAGEGIGIDRLTMMFANQPSIREVILFPHLRPESGAFPHGGDRGDI